MLDRLLSWLRGSPAPAAAAARADERPEANDEPRESGDQPRPAAPRQPAASLAPPVRPSKAERKAERKAGERDARRVRELEQRLAKAEERARRADTSRGERDDELTAARERAEQASERAKRAEAALKREQETKAREAKQRRAKPDAGAAKLKAADDARRAAERRASDAELRSQELTTELGELQRRVERLEEERDELRRRAEKAESRATTMERELLSKEVESPHARARPRTTLDVYFSPGDECLLAIRRQLDAAERAIDACVFTITDDRLAESLLAAHRRGVAVRVITDNDKAHDEGSDVRRLERAGVAVREDHSPFHMHHKFAVVDGRVALTGSYNWTRGAAHNNEENLVVSNDPRLVGPLEREFKALWTRLSPEP